MADDATAASWNPGGLTQLERPEVSVVGRGVYQVDRIGHASETIEINDATQTNTVNGETDSFTSFDLNYLSAAVPFSVCGRNLVVSLNYQQMLSFDRDLNFQVTNQGTGIRSDSEVSLEQRGGVDAATIALAIEPIEDFSLGAAVNYWVDGLAHSYAWRETYEYTGITVVDGFGTFPGDDGSIDTFDHFRGVNATFGLLWRFHPTAAVGAVWKLPFTAHVHHEIRSSVDPTREPLSAKHRLQLPASYGIGVSWRPLDALTLSTDVTYVDWNHFRAVDSTGTEYLVTGDPANEYSVDGIFTPRIGAEYLWTTASYSVAARTGVFYDPEPARGSPRNYYGGSVGTGLTIAGTNVDFAYQIRFGVDVKNTSTAIQLLDLAAVPIDTFQHLFYLSLIQHF